MNRKQFFAALLSPFAAKPRPNITAGNISGSIQCSKIADVPVLHLPKPPDWRDLDRLASGDLYIDESGILRRKP